MKILLTSHVFLPDFGSGTEILTLNTCKELQARGFHVEVCTGYPLDTPPADGQWFDSYEYDGIRVHRFKQHPTAYDNRSHAAAAEYNNQFYAQWFKGFIADYRPDIVHFFHLGVLSASIIDKCAELGIPMIMTPTDFWLICPNNQLRLPNNQPCSGPDYDSINCIKHAVWHNQPGYVAQPFQYFPNRLVSIMVAGIEKGAFSKSWFSPMVKALHQRSGFLKERMNKLDRVIAPTRIMETMLTKHGMDPDRIVFSQYGIQSVARKPRIPSQQGRFRLGFIGGLSEHKGAHVLVSAVRLLAHLPEIELKIFGRADLNIPYIEKLQRLIDGDSRIQFCGTFPNNEIGTVFASLDTLIVPSVWYENTPLVIYSAQAGGCPVIASNLGGMSEVIQHEKNGLLFEAGNTRALADTIERIFKDKDLHMRLSENSLTPKSITTYVTELVAIYDEVLSMRDSKQ